MTVTELVALEIDTDASIGDDHLDTELDAFLADPLGFGHLDPADPITLDEFVSARHHRGRYVAPLAF